MPDRKRVEQFVGMLGSEHDGERANAARFLQKMADAEKKTMVEFFSSIFGGSGSTRIVYQDRIVEKTVYRDRPQAPTPEPNEAPREPKRDTNLHGAARRAYGYGSMSGKIRTALSHHTSKMSQFERDFMKDVAEKVDKGIDLTPRQRKVLSEIFSKVGM